ncbi:MAG: hypothetical protein ACM35H_04410, partial [Bacteroidota bacterium]
AALAVSYDCHRAIAPPSPKRAMRPDCDCPAAAMRFFTPDGGFTPDSAFTYAAPEDAAWRRAGPVFRLL